MFIDIIIIHIFNDNPPVYSILGQHPTSSEPLAHTMPWPSFAAARGEGAELGAPTTRDKPTNSKIYPVAI